MKLFSIAFLAVLLPMLLLDLLWLALMVKRFYLPYLSQLMAPDPNLIAALIFYLIYAFGVTLLIVLPSVTSHSSLLRVFLLGGVFGLVAYATYDLTNLATLKQWPLLLTIVDLSWGTLLTGIVSWLAAIFTSKFI